MGGLGGVCVSVCMGKGEGVCVCCWRGGRGGMGDHGMTMCGCMCVHGWKGGRGGIGDQGMSGVDV